MLQENETKETIDLEKCNINDLIAKIEKDPLPTNIFTTEEDDPLVLLGKLNEVIACLKGIKALISSSDSKANEALAKALDAVINASEAVKTAQEAKMTAEDLGSEAKSTAENAVAVANGANANAREAISTANEANEEAKSAHDLATDAIGEASSAIKTANEALEQVVAGLGTKVFDNHGQLMANAKFTGHNHINVDMDETNPETFNIRLDDTITTAIEDNHTQGQTNKTSIENLTNQIKNVEKDLATKISTTTISAEFDANTLTQSMLYQIKTTAGKNMPTTNWGALLAIRNDSEHITQFFMGDQKQVFMRVYNSNGWQDWQEFTKDLTITTTTAGSTTTFDFMLGGGVFLSVEKSTAPSGQVSYLPTFKWYDSLTKKYINLISFYNSKPSFFGTAMVDWINSYNATANPPKWLTLGNSGLIVQFFTANVANGSPWVTLPKEMTSTNYICVGWQQKKGNNDWDKSTLIKKETTRFQVNNEAYAMLFNFIVIGK